jgi:pyroglutamyl-peptidase
MNQPPQPPQPQHQPLRILLTGFEPFGGQSLNPSWEVARALDGALIGGSVAGGGEAGSGDLGSAARSGMGDPSAQVTAVQLPCVFAQALPALQQALAQHRPDLVLALGQAEGRCDVSVERVAINTLDARIADNAGAQPIDVPVLAGGPAAYFSSLPIKALVAGLKAAGFPASVSQTAGTFVCNQVFYALQHALSGQGVRSGFMHLPLLPEQAAQWPGPSLPSWPVGLQVAAVRQALVLLVAHRRSGQGDLLQTGGTLN